jgi:N-acetylmuramoyl-L-alanine amidase
MLDPGHGGIDTGAVRGFAKESELVLKVAEQLKKILAQDKKFEVSMTRTQDVNLTLPERVQKAEKSKADLFVSLHANSASDPRAKGVEILYRPTKKVFF